MEVKKVDIKKLKSHPKNPRVHPESAIKKLERSIKEFGWTNPILVSKDGYILAGHARLKAAKRAGLEEVPVIYLPLEGAKAEAYMIADNRLQQDTDWDEEILRDLIVDLENDIDLTMTGLEENEIDKLMEDLEIKEREKPEVEFTEELLEEHNYVVLYFDNSLDWQVAKEVFELDTVMAFVDERNRKNRNYQRSGIGRVVKGSEYSDVLRDYKGV